MLDHPQAEVSINTSQNRFELRLNGDIVGIMGFFEADGVRDKATRKPVMSYMHTVITEDFGHRGLAGVLVKGALQYARNVGWLVNPVCTYVRRFLAAHPDYRDVLLPPAASAPKVATVSA